VSAREQLRAQVVEVGRRLYARGLIAGNEGNVSVRDGDDLLVTPGGVCKGFLAPEDVVRTDLDGRPRDGGRATSEIRMHAAVYRRRGDVGAVVHAHPPVATAFAVAGLPLDRPLLAEPVVTLGPVPVIPFGPPSTTELAEGVAEAVAAAQALLLANHGALTVGETLLRAWERMETLEQFARITLAARLLGRERELRPEDVARLEAMRAAAGYPPPPQAPGEESVPAERPTVAPSPDLVAAITEAVARALRPGP
jgi:L-fuculose-phosphate aldolase